MSFSQISPTTYHYRYGEEDSPKGFVAEVTWTENYPNEVPEINLDLFCNRHLVQEVRDGIQTKLLEQAELNTGALLQGICRFVLVYDIHMNIGL